MQFAKKSKARKERWGERVKEREGERERAKRVPAAKSWLCMGTKGGTIKKFRTHQAIFRPADKCAIAIYAPVPSKQ
jgi:hypothetical protein